MQNPTARRSTNDYTVAWICAIKCEREAARAALDEIHNDPPSGVPGDTNAYIYGRIGALDVVIAHLPAGVYGTNAAAVVAANMNRTFPRLRFRLMVGVGGGVPRGKDADIRLGDVVVSQPSSTSPGVVRYEPAKILEGQVPLPSISLNKPPWEILQQSAALQDRHNHQDAAPLKAILDEITSKLGFEFRYQGRANDVLYEAGYRHEGDDTCELCDEKKTVNMFPRNSTNPKIFYGTIASGNQVIKDSVTRDFWQKCEGAICFETEAAGLMDHFPCLVIRGICDYADSHKNKQWQPYAATTAAAYAKDLLLHISLTEQYFPDEQAASKQASTSNKLNEFFEVPRPVNTLFEGRTDELETLKQSLLPTDTSGTSSKVFVIYGMGGAGKSEVALKFAFESRFRFWGVFWIDASTEGSATRDFENIAKSCNFGDGSFQAAKSGLQNSTHSWLLIIDNADDLNFNYASYIPSGMNGSVLITSRNPECTTHQTVGSERFERLEKDTAVTLLLKACSIPMATQEDYGHASAVAELLGHHALAIVQAGAAIRKGLSTLSDYEQLYRVERETLLDHFPKQANSRYGGVYATFEVSAAYLQTLSRDSNDRTARDALSILDFLGTVHFSAFNPAIFEEAWTYSRTIMAKAKSLLLEPVETPKIAQRAKVRSSIPVMVSRLNRSSSKQRTENVPPFAVIWECGPQHVETLPEFLRENRSGQLDKVGLQKALSLLVSFSLIILSTPVGTISMHPVAHKWAKDRQRSLEKRSHSWTSAAATLSLSLSDDPHSKTSQVYWRDLRPHILSLADVPLSTSILSHELAFQQSLYRFALFLHTSRSFAEAYALLRHIPLDSYLNRAQTDNGQFLRITLILILGHLGRSDEADALLSVISDAQSSTTARSALFATQVFMANRHEKHGRHAEAIQIYKQLLETDPETDMVQSNLAICYLKQNTNVAEAVQRLEYIVRKLLLARYPSHPELVNSKLWLVEAFRQRGKEMTQDEGAQNEAYTKARRLLDEILSLDHIELPADSEYRIAAEGHCIALSRAVAQSIQGDWPLPGVDEAQIS